MAIRATLVLLLLACQSAPAATPPGPGPTQPDATRLPQGTATQEPTAGRLPGKDMGTGDELESAAPCLDRELRKRGLDKYGEPPGTMYPGGTPLFNEATGKRQDRTQHVYARHPDIAKACGAADAGP